MKFSTVLAAVASNKAVCSSFDAATVCPALVGLPTTPVAQPHTTIDQLTAPALNTAKENALNGEYWHYCVDIN